MNIIWAQNIMSFIADLFNQYQIALLSHDEMDRSPKFPNISTLITTIDQYPECYDIEDILMHGRS